MYHYGINRDRVRRYVQAGFQDQRIADIIGVSRERVRQLRTKLGLDKVRRWSRDPRPCLAPNTEPHTFVRTAPKQRRCEYHRFTVHTCATCGAEYSGVRDTAICRVCRNRENSRAHRKKAA